jgi:2-polyprenyl-6-methoxyphenol hydroxylase-like FAD-dependent oxidoreductase
MRVQVLGGGPAGLTLAILLKRHDPSHAVRVVERGPRGATWGFGVVFSDRALDFLRADAPELHDLLTPCMQSWRDLTIVHSNVRIPIGGNGFASIGRLELLGALQQEAERLGVASTTSARPTCTWRPTARSRRHAMHAPQRSVPRWIGAATASCGTARRCRSRR